MPARSRGHGRTVSNWFADDFKRASLGANWVVPNGLAAIVTSTELGASAFSGIHIAAYPGTIGNDQYAEATISPTVDPLMQKAVFCRRRSSDLARYGWFYKNDPAFDFPGAADGPAQWCFKYDGVPTAQTRFLGLGVATAPAPSPGDRLRMEVRGQSPVTLYGYCNGILLLQVDDVDASRILGGNPGAAFRANSGATLTYPSKVFADFSTGTLI